MRYDALFLWTAIAALALDRATKALADAFLSSSTPIIPGVLHFTPVLNAGAGFGILPGGRWLFVALAAIVTALILASYRDLAKEKTSALAGALIIAGGLGNAIDRVASGAVLDFIDFRIWPAFNVADIALTIGGVLLVLSLVRGRDGDGRRGARSAPTTPGRRARARESRRRSRAAGR